MDSDIKLQDGGIVEVFGDKLKAGIPHVELGVSTSGIIKLNGDNHIRAKAKTVGIEGDEKVWIDGNQISLKAAVGNDYDGYQINALELSTTNLRVGTISGAEGYDEEFSGFSLESGDIQIGGKVLSKANIVEIGSGTIQMESDVLRANAGDMEIGAIDANDKFRGIKVHKVKEELVKIQTGVYPAPDKEYPYADLSSKVVVKTTINCPVIVDATFTAQAITVPAGGKLLLLRPEKQSNITGVQVKKPAPMDVLETLEALLRRVGDLENKVKELQGKVGG